MRAALLAVLSLASLFAAAESSCATESAGGVSRTAQQQAAPRPQLVFWYTSAGPERAACMRLVEDLQRLPDFHERLHSRFHWRWANADTDVVSRCLAGVVRCPTILGPGGLRIVGYTTPDDLLMRLGLGALPVQERPLVRVPIDSHDVAATPAAQSPVAPPVVTPQDLDGLRTLSTEQWRDLQARLDQVDRRLAGTTNGDDLQALQAVVIDQAQQSRQHAAGALRQLDGRIAERFAAAAQGVKAELIDLTKPAAGSPQQAAPTNAEPPKVLQIASRVIGLGGLIAKVVPGAQPLAPVLDVASWVIGGGFGWGLIGRLLGRRRAQADPVGAPAVPSPVQQLVPVPVESRPAEVHTVEQRFVRVETNRLAQALAWANEQIVRKYPGHTDVVEMQKSLIDQWLGATHSQGKDR